MNKNTVHIPFLDVLRGAAILIVFCCHCLGAAFGFDRIVWNGWWVDFNVPDSFTAYLTSSFSWAGVSVFFVVSGFCIHLSHQRSNGNFADFFLRRFFRIYPPYLIALLLFYLYPLRAHTWESLVDGLGLHVLLLHNFSQAAFYEINASFWSIAVEFQLYLLYPALLYLVKKLGWTRTLGIIGALEIFMRLYAGGFYTLTGTTPPRWFTGSPLFFWFSWTIGAATAENFLKEALPPFSKVSPAIFAGAIIVCSLVKPLSYFPFLLVALLTVSVIAIFLGRSAPGTWRPNALVRFVCAAGIVSYSLYLLHQPIIGMLSRMVRTHLPPYPVLFICFSSLLPLMLLSWVFYRFVELPSIQAGKWVVMKRRHFTGKP